LDKTPRHRSYSCNRIGGFAFSDSEHYSVFQDIVAYSSDDPQLMADLISRVLISRVLVSLILVMFIIFPLLFIFQILMRRRRKKDNEA